MAERTRPVSWNHLTLGMRISYTSRAGAIEKAEIVGLALHDVTVCVPDEPEARVVLKKDMHHLREVLQQ